MPPATSEAIRIAVLRRLSCWSSRSSRSSARYGLRRCPTGTSTSRNSIPTATSAFLSERRAPSSKGDDHADRRRADSSLECGQAHQPVAPADPRLSQRRCPEGDGRRRCRCRHPHAAHAVGSERERALHGGRARASRPVRDPRQLPPRQAGEPRAGRHVEAAPGNARMPLHLHRPGAERAGLPIAMMAANFLPKVAEVAQRHPNLKLILDHLGRPRGDTSPGERWANLADVLALAKYPNVAMKATGAPSYSDQPYPFRDIHDNLRRLYDAFGPARWFWGTDITRMPCSWRQCVTLFTEELPWLKGRDLELVMGRAICDWLGWKR